MVLRYKFSTALLLLLYSFPVYSQHTHASIDSLIHQTLETYKIPAITAALILPDTCYYGLGGTIKMGADTPVQLEHKFHLGSNTKAITSFIAFRMIEAKQMELSTTFLELFPELEEELLDAYKKITLGDLLSHHAGIGAYTSGFEYYKLPKLKGSPAENRLEFAKFVLKEKPVPDGTYSNAGYALAALMLEKKSGKSYEALLEQNLAELGLNYFIGFPNHEDAKAPWGHWEANNTLTPLEPDNTYQMKDFMAPAGDLSMSVIDYSTFLQIQLKGLLGEDNVLTSERYQQLHFELDDYSYGWGNFTKDGIKSSYHDGTLGTFYCHTMVFPESKTAVTILANAASPNHVKGIYELREAILKIKR